MKFYLHNSYEDRVLTLPAGGTWYFAERGEAESVLDACREYVSSLGMDPAEFTVREEPETCQSRPPERD